MKRLLCIWLPNWPIQRLHSPIAAAPKSRFQTPQPSSAASASDSPTSRAGKPADHSPTGRVGLSGKEREKRLHTTKPTILWRIDPRRGRLVIGCCDRASTMGVRIGMPIAQATELAAATNQQPDVVMHDPELDQQAIDQLATYLQKHVSPLIAIESLDDKPWDGQVLHQPDALLCDITGIAHLFGDEAGLLQAADKQLRSQGYVGRLSIADTVGAAWALAHYHPQRVLVHHQQQPQLAALPVQALRIGTPTVKTLARLGVTRIGELLSLPRAGLATRLGDHLTKRLGQLLGEVDEPLNVHRAPAEDTYQIELEYPTDDWAILADRIRVLTEKVRAGLASRQRGALRLACCLALTDHPPLTFEIGFFAPTLDADHMLRLMTGCIENRKLPSSVQRITVSVTLSGSLRSSQNSLFGDTHDAMTVNDSVGGSSLARTLDALSGRLGRDAVLGVLPSDDPLPEKAYELYPLTGQKPVRKQLRPKRSRSNSSQQHSVHDPSRGGTLQPSREDALRRPINLLDSPIPLSAVDDDESCPPNRVPFAFRLGGKLHRIVRYWGPERIETGWWHGPSIRRDYFRIETDQGHWWWVYRNLTPENSTKETERRHRWMLHGRFA